MRGGQLELGFVVAIVVDALAGLSVDAVLIEVDAELDEAVDEELDDDDDDDDDVSSIFSEVDEAIVGGRGRHLQRTGHCPPAAE